MTWVLEEPLPELDGQTAAACEAVLAELAEWTSDGDAHNFEIRSQLPFFRTLYDRFLAICRDRFEPFALRADNSRACWAYVQNRERFASVWHDHTRTASINGVYYLAVPDPTGAIRFQLDGHEWELAPNQGSLYVFPCWLVHKPMPQASDAWRISINVEVRTAAPPVQRGGRRW